MGCMRSGMKHGCRLLGLCGVGMWHVTSAPMVCSDEGYYDVSIIGGGVVGLAIARELSTRGLSVHLSERMPHIASMASSGNR